MFVWSFREIDKSQGLSAAQFFDRVNSFESFAVFASTQLKRCFIIKGDAIVQPSCSRSVQSFSVLKEHWVMWKQNRQKKQ